MGIGFNTQIIGSYHAISIVENKNLSVRKKRLLHRNYSNNVPLLLVHLLKE